MQSVIDLKVWGRGHRSANTYIGRRLTSLGRLIGSKTIGVVGAWIQTYRVMYSVVLALMMIEGVL